MSSLTYDESYFHGNDEAGYSNYRRNLWPEDGFSSFVDRARTLVEKMADRGASIEQRTVLVLGCAFGYSVEYLVSMGVDAYGMDISAYAISQAPASIASRLMVGDARVRGDLNSARGMAGLRGQNRYDLIVSEDLLPCFTDADAVAAATEWRRHAMRSLHRISIGDYGGGYTLHTLAEWRALLGSQDWIVNYTTWEEG